MNGRGLAGMVLVAWCGTVGVVDASSPHEAQDVRRVLDPGTGLEVRVSQLSTGIVAFEVGEGQTVIRKEIGGGRSVTSIQVDGESVILTMDATGLSVAAGGVTALVPLNRPERLGAVRDLLNGSRVARTGAQLLSRLRLDEHTSAGQAFLLTRALLQAAAGDVRGVAEIGALTQTPPATPRLVPARAEATRPDCYDTYTAAAQQIMQSYMNCFTSAAWWDVVTKGLCAMWYDIQAEQIFGSLLSCYGVTYL